MEYFLMTIQVVFGILFPIFCLLLLFILYLALKDFLEEKEVERRNKDFENACWIFHHFEASGGFYKTHMVFKSNDKELKIKVDKDLVKITGQ